MDITKNMAHKKPSRGIVKVVSTLALAALAYAALGPLALAQVYTPTPPSPNVLELSTNFPAPSGPFTAKGCGFAPGTAIDVTIAGTTVSSISAGPDGCGFASLVAPSDPGTYTVCFTGMTPSETVQQLCNTITVRVAGAAAPVPGRQLPFTGSQNLGKLVVGGMLMVAAGGLLLVYARRRAEEL